jgi:hypothetical protein
MSQKNLKHGDALLTDIAEGLRVQDGKIGCLEVVFVCPGGARHTFDLASALEAIAKDLYWGPDGNWADATSAILRTI